MAKKRDEGSKRSPRKTIHDMVNQALHRRGRGYDAVRVVEPSALRTVMAAAERLQIVPGVGPTGHLGHDVVHLGRGITAARPKDEGREDHEATAHVHDHSTRTGEGH